MSTEYFVVRTSGEPGNWSGSLKVTKFPDGATAPTSVYTLHLKDLLSQCECKGYLNRGKCRHTMMVEDFMRQREPVPFSVVLED